MLGKGSFGVVHKAVHVETGKEYAIKSIDVTRTTHQNKMYLITELRVLATHKCPFLVAFKEAYFENRCLHIVTEYASRGDLSHMIRSKIRQSAYFSEFDVWHYFLQMCIAIDYLHQLNVLHRDIKPANVLVTRDNCIKLADVGVGKVMRAAKFTYTQVGTPLYMSPEVFKRERYDSKTDAWSLGCVLYELMHLRPAFTGGNIVALRENIFRGCPRVLPNVRRYNKTLHDVVRSLLTIHIRARPSIRDVLAWPVVLTEITRRGMGFATAERDVKPLFHVPCVIPQTMDGWQRVVTLFCDLNNTIQLDAGVDARMAEIHRLRTALMNGVSVHAELSRLSEQLERARADVVRLEKKIALLKECAHELSPAPEP